MAMSSRDKALALVLPAVIVVGGYGYFVFKNKLVEERELTKTVDKTRAAAPSQEQILLALGRAKHVQEENQGIQIEIDKTNARIQEVLARLADPAQRNERIEKLTKLLAKYDLGPVDDKADTARDTRLPKALETLAQRVAELSKKPQPHLLHLSFTGRYSDVYHVLNELSQGEVLAVPVSLSMKTTEDPERRAWTVLLWI